MGRKGDEIMNFNEILIFGDIHGRTPEKLKEVAAPDTAIILLGDVGANFTQGERDKKFKQELNELNTNLYLIRGNHDVRPLDIPTIEIVYDEKVQNDVGQEAAYPNIHYLLDGRVYDFNGNKSLVLGGAFSVDKFSRLMRHDIWVENEQLSAEEQAFIEAHLPPIHFNWVLTHTCPFTWMPTDLLLTCLDCDWIDNSTEKWLERLSRTIDWDAWFFGHFHDTREIEKNKIYLLDDTNCYSDNKKGLVF